MESGRLGQPAQDAEKVNPWVDPFFHPTLAEHRDVGYFVLPPGISL
jgi:hypothetical protein